MASFDELQKAFYDNHYRIRDNSTPKNEVNRLLKENRRILKELDNHVGLNGSN